MAEIENQITEGDTKTHPLLLLSKGSLHWFSDASEEAYAGVVYLRMLDEIGNVHVSLVMSKTKVSPIKRQTIPHLELCGALLLARLVYHIKHVFDMSIDNVYAWTDTSVVLSWLIGSPKASRHMSVTESPPSLI